MGRMVAHGDGGLDCGVNGGEGITTCLDCRRREHHLGVPASAAAVDLQLDLGCACATALLGFVGLGRRRLEGPAGDAVQRGAGEKRRTSPEESPMLACSLLDEPAEVCALMDVDKPPALAYTPCLDCRMQMHVELK
ncbi:unnamed protein product [Urochloa humidicola]